MRIIIQSFKFTFSIGFVVLFLQTPPAQADGGEDYYKALRKLKKFDRATLDEIKKNTIDAEQIKKVNELARQNTEHNKLIDSKKVPRPADAPKDEESEKEEMAHLDQEKMKADVGKTHAPKAPAGTKTAQDSPPEPVNAKPGKVTKASSRSESHSAPIKVSSETPDELSFPGTDDESENEKGANAPAPAPKKK